MCVYICLFIYLLFCFFYGCTWTSIWASNKTPESFSRVLQVGPGLCAFSQEVWSLAIIAPNKQTLHYSVEQGDFLCFFIIKNLEKQPRFSLFFLVCMDNTLDPGLFIYLFIYIPPLGFVMLKILAKSTIK